ncbi:MAG: AsmA-like C-terminal region-containing protein [Pseudomonadota bacterium]
MARILRVAAVIVGVVVLILGAGIGYLAADPGALRGPVLAALSSALDGEVEAGGDVSLSFDPAPGLTLEALTINVPPTQAIHGELEAARLTANIDLFAYLGGTLRLSRIEAAGVSGAITVSEATDEPAAPAPEAAIDLPAVSIGIEELRLSLPGREDVVLAGTEIALGVSAEALSGPRLMETLAVDLDLAMPSFAPQGPDGPQLRDLSLALERPAGGDATVILEAEVDIPGETLRGPAGVELDAMVSANAQRLTLDRLVLRLAEGTVEGEGSIDLAAERPVVDLALTSDALDFSHLFPEGEATEGPMIPPAPLPTVAPPVEATVSLAVETLGLGGIGQLDAVQLLLRQEGELLRLDELTAQRRDGRVSAEGTVDFTAELPAFALTLDADEMPVADWVPPSRRIDLRDSRLSIDAGLQGSGSDLRSLVADLTGTVTTGMAGGRVRLGLIPAGAAGIDQAIGRMLSRQETMALNCAYGVWTLDGGVASSGGVIIAAEALTVAGSGWIDLLDETLSLDVAVEPAAASLLPAATALQIRGPIKAPQAVPRPIGALTTALNAASAPVNPLGILATIEGAPQSARSLGTCRGAVQTGATSTAVPERLVPLIPAPAQGLIREGSDKVRELGRGLRSIFD